MRFLPLHFFADIPYRYEVILLEATSTPTHQTALNVPASSPRFCFLIHDIPGKIPASHGILTDQLRFSSQFSLFPTS